jgi:hypothetical protein
LLYLLYQIEASYSFHPTTSLCLALFLSETNQVTDFTIAAMSHIISHGKHFYMVLEND